MMKTYLKTGFLALVFGVLITPLHASAAVGDNCALDILGNIPAGADWTNIHTLEGEYGSAWRRGLVFEPKGILELNESQSTKIAATVLPGVETLVFLYARQIDSEGKLLPPANGTCFEGAVADATGTTRFPINSRILWEGLGSKLVIDVFYRMDEPWSEIQSFNGSQEMLFSAHVAPKIIDISIDDAAQATLETKGKVVFRDQNFANSNDMQLYERGSIGDQRLKGIGWSDHGCRTYCDGDVQQGVLLDPSGLPHEWHGGNFDATGSQAVVIGRTPGPHTFYANLFDTQYTTDVSILRPLVLKALYMEAIKRALLGNPHVQGEMPSLTLLDGRQLKVAASNQGGYSQRTVQLVRNIRYLFTRPELRQSAAKFIDDTIRGTSSFLFRKQDIEWNMERALLEIIPEGVATSETWADDFVRLLEFWTGSSLENVCLMLNDDAFVENFHLHGTELDYCGFTYALGKTPTIVLHTEREMQLKPDFHGVSMTYANRTFDREETFVLPSGKKEALYYRYTPTSQLTPRPIASFCVAKQNLSQIIDQLKNAYQLYPSEVNALSRELHTNWPSADAGALQSFELVHPADIAHYFRWQGNGASLDLLQLFFRFQENKDCSNYQAVLPVLESSEQRDGFEAGILHSI